MRWNPKTRMLSSLIVSRFASFLSAGCSCFCRCVFFYSKPEVLLREHFLIWIIWNGSRLMFVESLGNMFPHCLRTLQGVLKCFHNICTDSCWFAYWINKNRKCIPVNTKCVDFYFLLFQRGHQNSLEWMPVFFMLMIVGGIGYPLSCAALGTLYTVTRYFYFTGYSTGEPENRLKLGYVFLIP